MGRLFFASLLFVCFNSNAQPTIYSAANGHSHNDYEQLVPFWDAWRQEFGSIEADIFLDNGELIVAHDKKQVSRRWTLDSLYLQPLQRCIAANNGYVYKDSSRQLQLLVDVKSEAVPALTQLVKKLNTFPSLINNSSLRIVISGNRPPASEFSLWPPWIRFDGELQKEYSPAELEKIDMLSDNFAKHSSWKGKEGLPSDEKTIIQSLVDKAHRLQKKIRFWNAPDLLKSWYSFSGMGVDYINTDHIAELGNFLKHLPNRNYTSGSTYELYKPTWKNDGKNKPVKNIILLVGDGTGLAQWYAGYTANKGALNVFNMHFSGLSKTSSFDSYITDSAPGATAFSSGVKTHNRAVGIDHEGNKLDLLPAILHQRKKKTGIITTGDLRDATPAAFYAHQRERSSYAAILNDLMSAPIDLIAGACDLSKQDSVVNRVKTNFEFLSSIDNSKANATRPLFIADPKAKLSVLNGRNDWSQKAFDAAINLLSRNKEGFLLMLEGAQIDHGGHANKLPYVVTELLDFDKVIGKAMEYADSNGETLVIVTGDHETGGLTLTGGDYKKGFISGQFSTGGHTAIPVPVFAYGPQSHLFAGTYENTGIFDRVLQALGIKQ
jgi:alkaline phosphatase